VIAVIAAHRDLDAIAVDLRREVEGADRAWRTAVEHAVRAGELLTEAKAQVQHGEWLRWLQAHFPGAPRPAQDYMRLARHAEDARALERLKRAVADASAAGEEGDGE